MNSDTSNFLKRFIPFSLILFLIHFFIVLKFSKGITFFYPIYTIYLFHSITTALVCLIIIYINKIAADNTGFAFMALSILKMLAAILFLIPLIQLDKEQKLADIIAFFIPYFAFLFFELTFIIKLLNGFKK
ncbi:MAG TPA: hypothetical protein VIN72_08920 [Lutibacter sp.]